MQGPKQGRGTAAGMPLKGLLAAVVLGTLLLPLTAGAVQLGEKKDGQVMSGGTLDVTQTLYYKYNVFLDENPSDDIRSPFPFSEFINRTQADLRLGPFTLGVQFDFAATSPTCSDSSFADKYAEEFGADAPCVHPNELRGSGWSDKVPRNALAMLEKVYLKYQSKYFEAELGDFYVAVGRGLLLAMVRQPNIDQDNSLFGARFNVLTRKVDVTGFVGFTNPQEISQELRNQQIDRVPWGLLAGGWVNVRPVKNLALSVHGVGYELTELASGAVGGSVSVRNIGKAVDLFFEGNTFIYGQDPDAELNLPKTGYALYGTVTGYAGPLTMLFEFKRYKDAQLLRRGGPVVPLQYNQPPSLEYQIAVTEDVNGSIVSNDIIGGRLQGELFFLMSNTTLTASVLGAVDQESHPPFSKQGEVTIHPWVALDQGLHVGKTDFHLQAAVGYRHDFPFRLAPGDDVTDEERIDLRTEYLRNTGLLHWNVDFGVTIGKHSFEWVSYFRRHSFTLEEEGCWTRRNGDETCDKDDGWIANENALSYTLMGKYTVALHLDFTDDPLVQSLGNSGAVGNLVYDPWFKSSAFIGAEIIIKPVPELEIYAFGGSQKAGIVCTGGACRTVPAFTGFKSKVTVTF
ncbi:MAG: hypothetical protein KDA24_15065 [Deltaproteobacteria bacterium]|nr:hypothetical protein [Deltaproteobacteria bacterium]